MNTNELAAPKWTKPIRLPPEIDVTHATPPCVTAGARVVLKLPFALSRAVPAEGQLRLQIQGGRNNRGGFQSAQVDQPGAEGYLSAGLAAGTRLALRTFKRDAVFDLDTPPEGFPPGTRIDVTLGDPAGGCPGIRITDGYILNKFCVLYLAPPADGAAPPRWAGGDTWNDQMAPHIVAACTFHIRGGTLAALKAYAPAGVKPDTPFAILIRPEDAHGNLAVETPGDLILSVNGRPLDAIRSSVPDSTCVRLSVRLPAASDAWRIDVRLAGTPIQARTNPILCRSDVAPAYWGLIHGHTELSDGTGSLDQYFRQLQSEVGLDFAASSDHDHTWETPESFWNITGDTVQRWNQPGVFPTLLGYEWAKWRQNGDGDRNVYYRSDRQPMLRSDDGHYPTPPDLFAALHRNRAPAIVIPHHPAHGGNFCDWKDHDPAFERLVEIFQVRGSYECAAEEDNPLPEKTNRESLFPGGHVRTALALGWRVGFTAGGDDHRGDWGTEATIEFFYKQGLMCVQAAELTREAIFDALYQRRVTATSGPRILLNWSLNGAPLGSEIRLTEPQPRKIEIDFHGTAPAARIDIIRNNRVAHSIPGQGRWDITTHWTDAENLATLWMPPALHCAHPFAVYYIRAVQTDGEVAWASPIWIDP